MLKPLTVWITRTWKILEDVGIPRPPYLSPEEPGQEATVRTELLELGQQTGSKLGKEYGK